MEYGTDNQGLGTSERMVADEEILLVGGQVLLTACTVSYIQVIKRLIKETYALIMLHRHDDTIDVVLMKAALEEVDGEAWQFLAQLRPQHLIKIEKITFSFVEFLHSSYESSSKKQIRQQSIPAESRDSVS